jgi:hypothetical protein
VRLDVAARRGSVAAAVVEPQALRVAARGGDRCEVLRIDGRTARGRRDRGRAERRDPAAQVRREHLLELDERADRGLLDSGHGRAGRGAEADRDRDRLVLVEQQRRHRRPGAQPVPARRPGERLDRVAQAAQPLDVAANRAARHAQALGQLRARPVAPTLEQREQAEQAAGGLGHDAGRIARIEDRS